VGRTAGRLALSEDQQIPTYEEALRRVELEPGQLVLDTLRRALVAPAGIAVLVGPDREEELKDTIVAGLASHRTADSGYRLQNEFHCLIARA
jgi:hypothetical protein